MHEMAQLDLFLHINPDFGVARAQKSPEKTFLQVEEEISLLFHIPGTVRQCGKLPSLKVPCSPNDNM
jgi:hypothetical protein